MVDTTISTNRKLVKADPSKGVRVDAAVIAQHFRDEIKANVAELKAQGIGKYIYLLSDVMIKTQVKYVPH